ncbi:MAG: trypsin-like peptidase domain-containing protein [Rubrobacteraceae bacterium]
MLSPVRGGGAIIVIRHAATDRSEPDDAQVDLDDCSTQRNLTDEGRADARTIGEAFRELRIPVGTVWASPYCRARETADLAFGRAEEIDGLERLYPEPDEVAERRINRLVREQAPAPGDPNMVISGHGVYPSVLEPAVPIAEGEAAVYAVRGDDFALLGRIAPDEWAGLDPGAGELSGVADRVLDSVVSVRVGQGDHSGSGFRVAVPGIVVTNAHVVADADEVSVVLRDGTRRTARVLGRAPEVDIAALELDDSGLPPLHSGSGISEARVGDPVLAVGFSHEQADAAMSGTVRSLNRPVRLGDGAKLGAVQTDASINAGSSGGPLVNARGEVLGVLTTVAAPDNGASDGFAIPVEVARSETLEIVRSE